MYCTFTIPTVCTVHSLYLQYVLYIHYTYSMYCTFTIPTVCTVHSLYLQYVLYIHYTYSMYCTFTIHTYSMYDSIYRYQTYNNKDNYHIKFQNIFCISLITMLNNSKYYINQISTNCQLTPYLLLCNHQT